MATFKTLKDNTLRDRARALRRADTDAGARLWNAYLERLGLRVLRFWNSAVLTNGDGVFATILDACGGEHPAAGPG